MSGHQPLSFRLQRFVTEYLATGNATEAAKRAGYSPKTTYSQGQRLLKNVEVKKLLLVTYPSESTVCRYFCRKPAQFWIRIE